MTDAEPQVFDNLIPRRLQAVLADMIELPIWQYGHRSDGQRDRFPFWSAKFAECARGEEECESQLRATKIRGLVETWELLSANLFSGARLHRAYANAHTYGADGYPHTDSYPADATRTCVTFVHPYWHRDWGGELVFFDRTGRDVVRSVSPLPGRSVVFPGHLLHCARGVSRECNELRVSLVVKVRG